MPHNQLLDVAITAFGFHGPEGASTRQIAKAADSAMSAITYHYGGKEGLYLAAADHIAGIIYEAMEAHLDRAAAVSDDDAQGARDALKAMLAALSERMMASETADHSLFILREQMNPTAAFDRIYDGFIGKTFESACRMIRIVTGVDERTAAIITSGLVGLTMSPRSSKATLLRHLKIDQYDAATSVDIRACLESAIDAVLDGIATTSRAKDLP